MRRFNSILILSSALIMASCAEKSNQQAAAVVVEEAPKVTVTQVYAENVPQLSTYPTTVEAEVVNNITPQSASRINKILVDPILFIFALRLQQQRLLQQVQLRRNKQ